MLLSRPTLGCRARRLSMLGLSAPALLALSVSMLPQSAHAELRPAVLPEEICLVLANGPFDADVAARIAGRGDFAAILLQAESECPDLAGNLIGATASIPSGVQDKATDGPAPPAPPVVTTPPVNEAPPTPPTPPAQPPAAPPPIDTNPEEPPPDGTNPGDFETEPAIETPA